MLRRHADRILINTLNPAILTGVTANTVTIEGYGVLNFANQLNSFRTCTEPAVLQEVEVDVIIPASCDCPYEWTLTVECLPCLGLYETQNTFPASRVYGYEDPSGGVPTAAATAAAITASINADPFTCVTATVAGTVITLVQKAGTCGFNAFTPSGTVTITVPGVPAILSAEDMCRLFPIQPGQWGAKPNLPIAGDYCSYHFVERISADVQDVDGANHWNDYEKEVYFYIRPTDPNFAAFNAAFSALIPIANGGTRP